jgi:hypothetical protein
VSLPGNADIDPKALIASEFASYYKLPHPSC